MGLQIFWFSVIAVFWTGFFVLEGFDLGVGALHAVVGRTDVERRVAINTIGPFWDGNEVWLIVAGVLVGPGGGRRGFLGAQVPAGVAEHDRPASSRRAR